MKENKLTVVVNNYFKESILSQRSLEYEKSSKLAL